MHAQRPDIDNQHKVVLLGDSRVGKTSLLSRQLNGYQPNNLTPTIGCHCSELSFSVDGREVILQVWDTAGQEMYRSLVPVYLRGAHAAIIIYDVTDVESFNSLTHWYELLKDTVADTTPTFLVANKIDLLGANVESGQVVANDTAETFAESNHSKFFQASALTGEGVENIFLEVANAMAHSALNEPTPRLQDTPGQQKKCC